MSDDLTPLRELATEATPEVLNALAILASRRAWLAEVREVWPSAHGGTAELLSAAAVIVAERDTLIDRCERAERERDTLHTFALDVARHVASPGAEDLADRLTLDDLATILVCVRAEYGKGHQAGSAAQLSRCAEDMSRAFGMVRQIPAWDAVVAQARETVAERDTLRARVSGYQTELAEVDQTLGRALGYPPNPDGAPGVCTGDHTPATLAVEAAKRVGELEANLRRVLDVERESAVRAGLSGCTCMTKSRAAEHAYETGTCPHQLADAALGSPK